MGVVYSEYEVARVPSCSPRILTRLTLPEQFVVTAAKSHALA